MNPRAMWAAQSGPSKTLLGLQELFEAQAQHGPVLRLDDDVAPEFEDGDLAHAPTAAPTPALTAYDAEGAIGRAGDHVGATHLTAIQRPDARR